MNGLVGKASQWRPIGTWSGHMCADGKGDWNHHLLMGSLRIKDTGCGVSLQQEIPLRRKDRIYRKHRRD